MMSIILSLSLLAWTVERGMVSGRTQVDTGDSKPASIAPGEWQPVITVTAEPGHVYTEKAIVQFHPSGELYIAVNDTDPLGKERRIKLFKYDGSQVTFIRNISDGNLMAFEPDMFIGEDGWIHITWGEANNANAENQFIKYCFFNGAEWSSVRTLKALSIPGDVTGNNKEKLDDVRLTVDDDHNLYMAYMVWPSARSSSFSYVNGKVTDDTFPMTGRSKHPFMAIDDKYVHMIWVQMLGEYTIQYARRDKAPGSKWSRIVQLANGTVDRPTCRVDHDGGFHAIYLKTGQGESKRRIYYHYMENNGAFTPYRCISDGFLELFHPPDIGAYDKNNVAVYVSTWAGGLRNYYNWKNDGTWSGMYLFNQMGITESYITGVLSGNKIAAMAYSNGDSVQLAVSAPLVVNTLPVAVIQADKETIFWNESVTFNGNSSHDPDGLPIVSYQWRVIPDKVIVDGPTMTYQFSKSYGSVRVRLTVVDAKGGRGVVDKVITVNALYTSPCTVNLQLIQTLLYKRLGNVIKWEPNPKNEQAGYNIVNYRVFRKEVGGEWIQLGELPGDRRVFADPTVETGKTYYYSVTAVDDQGRQSPFDNF
jgi:hypothetical protein